MFLDFSNSGGVSMREEIRIYTLGRFRVFQGEKNLTKNRKQLSKRWKLFQYLITYRNREVSREELIMVLDLNDNNDPEASLTALVYRLRKLLKSNEYGKDLIKTLGTAIVLMRIMTIGWMSNILKNYAGDLFRK